MNSKKITKEIRLIFLAFIILAIGALGAFSFIFYQTNLLHSISSDIYNHPMKVSNAALSIKSEILKIHKSVKESSLDSFQNELPVLIQDINEHEKHISQNLSVIEKNILGEDGQKLYEKTQKLLIDWKKTHEYISTLVNNNNFTEAAKITKTQYTEQVLKLEISLSKIYEYAQNKAVNFKNEADKTYEKVETNKFLIIEVLIVLLILITYYIVKVILKYINQNEHLTGVMSIIRDVNQLIVREKDKQELIQKSCDILASKHVFIDAWIVLTGSDKKIEYIAGTDKQNNFTLFKERVQKGWVPDCVEKTIENNNSYSIIKRTKENCVECPLADLYGNKSAYNIALRYNERYFGCLTISLDEKYLQYTHEVSLIEEVAGDIAYALNNIEIENSVLNLKELYDNVINSVENLIFVKDTNLNYIACNKAFEKFIGKSQNEIIGKTDYEIFDKEVADFFRKHDNVMFTDKVAKSNFEWLTYPDGSKLYFLTIKSPLLNSKGELLGLVGNSTNLTELILAKNELQISNEKFEKAFNQTPNLIIISNYETGKIYDVNQTFAKKFAYTKKELIGKKTTELDLWTSLDDRNEYLEIFNKAGVVEGEIYSFNTKNKDLIIAEVYSSLITIKNEKYILAVANDITQEQAMEQALLESEKHFKLLMQESPSVIEVYNLEGTQIEVNHAYEILWGHPASITLNKFNLFQSEEVKRTGLLEYVKRAYSGESVIVPLYEYDSRGKTEANGHGRVRILSSRIYPLKDLAGNFENIVITHEDVSDRENTHLQLEQKKRELETIIQEAPTPMMLHNEDGKVILINKEWEKLTGYTYEDIDTIEKWTKKAYGEKLQVKEYIDSLYKLDQKVDEGEYSILTKNGDTIIWQFRSAPLGLIEGRRTVISSAMDITDLKKKDELMIIQSRHAAMGEMIGMIAHQWRQPISVIAMVANNILLDVALDEFNAGEAEEYSKNILEQTEHLSKTIDDFRNFFRPDKNISKVKIENILTETYAIVKDSLKNNNIEFKVVNKSDTEINVYSRELMQVFVNIINNAKDALISQKVEGAFVKVTISEDEDYVTTSICDNGGGISDNVILKVFDPYFTTKEEKNGTGLGLYMSKMIIEKHLHGKLEVVNKNNGVCFIVKLLKQF